MTKKDDTSFEEAFSRLENILEKLNSGDVSLDESLKMYEEADKLITHCGKRLNDAERKIEILVKQRDGELKIGEGGAPITEPFSPGHNQNNKS